MDTLEAIDARRSIRAFRDQPLPEGSGERILRAGSRAPSGKNRQPWRFVGVEGEGRAEMARVIVEALDAREAGGDDTGSARNTLHVMETAPLTVFVFNPYGIDPWLTRSTDQAFAELVDVQSVGAAIQNMLLAATASGIGSLWICDVLYAVTELKVWLGETGQLVAAVSFGIPDEAPPPRPRRPLTEIARWV